MAKVPFAGSVKTRLSPPLTPEEAATLRLLNEELGLSLNGVGAHTRYECGYDALFTRNYLAELIKEGGRERFMPVDQGSNPNK